MKNRQALITGERDKSGSNPWLDILIVTIFCAVVLTAAVGIVDRAKPVSVTPAEPLILIDPGHGGADGGAVAPTGRRKRRSISLFPCRWRTCCVSWATRSP